MDKVTSKSSDVFQANRDRAAPLLKQLRADGIGHIIDGKIVPSISGDTFETKSPIDGAAGMIWLNSENVRHLPTPFGGMKSSGIGRNGGDYSFDFYMETKHVSLARGTHKIQRLGLFSS
jgi:5-carboxymethyl-2-hydroxymuconic-semialdehyde dehydrogenase